MIPKLALESINQHLDKYEAEYLIKDNIVEFNGDKYPTYYYISYSNKEEQFYAGLGNNLSYFEKDFRKFHVEKIFVERIIKKLNNLLKSK
jgi:hypothetical protein